MSNSFVGSTKQSSVLTSGWIAMLQKKKSHPESWHLKGSLGRDSKEGEFARDQWHRGTRSAIQQPNVFIQQLTAVGLASCLNFMPDFAML